MSNIDQKDVEHIAGLARIKVNTKEKENLAKNLSDILNYVDKLKEVDTEGVEPIAHITGLEDVLRKDEIVGVFSEIEPESLVEQAPSSDKDNYVKVKSVFEDKK
ncbi:MAG: Asp-tRNA(Asn)/Glu-tRNA(Gln) amidotransferase subunit GatC [Candidatus Paceibacterota bacterium]